MPTQVTPPKILSIKLANGGTAKYHSRLTFSQQVEITEIGEKESAVKAGLFLIMKLMVSWDLVDEKNKKIPINFKSIDLYLDDTDINKIVTNLNKNNSIGVAKKKR